MEENEKVAMQEEDTTATASVENASKAEGKGEENSPSQQSEALTQEQVNSIVRERLARERKSILDKVGVEDEKGLDDFIKKGKGYDEISQKLDAMNDENLSLKERILFYENGILPEREDDVRTHFKGKGLQMSKDTLKSALESHPEWTKKEAPKTTIVPLGAEVPSMPKQSDEDKVAKMFGLDHFI